MSGQAHDKNGPQPAGPGIAPKTDNKEEYFMKTRFTRRQTMVMMGGAALATPRLALAQTAPDNLPGTMIWSTYDVGSTGYVEATAIADAMIKNYGSRIRLLPSGSGVGRILPMKQGQAQSAWLANELYFATRGTYDFAVPDWGPQNFRTLFGRPATFSICVTQESGIQTFDDLRGKRVAYAAANPSVSVKIDTLLASAGLTRDDVQVVEFPSYGDTLRSLAQGLADATGSALTSAALTELEASPKGIKWLEMDPNDEQLWETMNDVAPLFSPYKESIGVGISEENPVDVAAYKYPMVTVMADANPDETYAFIKAFDESFPGFKDAAPIMERWALEQSGKPPFDAPLHEGAIRYLEEKGMWTEKHQAWQDRSVKEVEALIAAWGEFKPANESKSAEEFAAAWDEVRQSTVDGL